MAALETDGAGRSSQDGSKDQPKHRISRQNVRNGLLLLLAISGLAYSFWSLSGGGSVVGDPSERIQEFSKTIRTIKAGKLGRVSPLKAFDLRDATIPRNEILSGGPPKDGIPALSNAAFVDAARATFLKPDDRVIGVHLEGVSRAYPLNILNYHEVVNDRIGSLPFAVTYCPLCDSAAVFDRRHAGDELEFGVSGLLYNSNVLMYDRGGTGGESLWSQMMAQSISGPRVTQSLKHLPVELTTWSDFKQRFPQAQVLSNETGNQRDYSVDAYAAYFRRQALVFPAKPIDKRLPLKARVLGVWSDRRQRAYPIDAFAGLKTVTHIDQELDGRKFRLTYNPRSRSIRITQADEGLKWMYSFWFAWAAFHPHMEIFSGLPSGE